MQYQNSSKTNKSRLGQISDSDAIRRIVEYLPAGSLRLLRKTAEMLLSKPGVARTEGGKKLLDDFGIRSAGEGNAGTDPRYRRPVFVGGQAEA